MPPLLRGTVGVLSLLAYVVGTAIFTIAVHGISTSDDVDVSKVTRSVLLALGLSGVGVGLQILRERGMPPTPRSPLRPRSLALAVAAIVVPVVHAWIQFERFEERISMWPMPVVLGGIWLGLVLGAALPFDRHRSTATMLLVSWVTLPLAMLAVGLPTRHFRIHGSGVHFVLVDADYERREYPMDAIAPEAPARETTALGPGTAELVEAMADAQPVEGVMVDGVLHVRNDAGELEPVQTADVDEIFARAKAADEEHRARERTAYREKLREHQRRIERLRRSGRLFSSPPP